MTLVNRDDVLQKVKNGATFMGVYYNGIGVLIQLKRDFCCDPVYRRFDKHAFDMATVVKAHAQRANLIKALYEELDLLIPKARSGDISHRERAIWIVNVWCLLKLNVLKNDERNGLQFASKSFCVE